MLIHPRRCGSVSGSQYRCVALIHSPHAADETGTPWASVASRTVHQTHTPMSAGAVASDTGTDQLASNRSSDAPRSPAHSLRDPWREGSLEAFRLTGDLTRATDRLTFLVPDLSETIREVQPPINDTSNKKFYPQPVLPIKYMYRRGPKEDLVHVTEVTLVDKDIIAILCNAHQVGHFHRVDISSLRVKARIFDFF